MNRSLVVYGKRRGIFEDIVQLAAFFGYNLVVDADRFPKDYTFPLSGALILTTDDSFALIKADAGYRALSFPEAMREAGIAVADGFMPDEDGREFSGGYSTHRAEAAGGFMTDDGAGDVAFERVVTDDKPPAPVTAPAILDAARGHLESRAALRDQAQGERSMSRTVEAFNAITGHDLSERDGWLFMVALKAARAATTPKGVPDDYQDGAAYFALAGESAA